MNKVTEIKEMQLFLKKKSFVLIEIKGTKKWKADIDSEYNVTQRNKC